MTKDKTEHPSNNVTPDEKRKKIILFSILILALAVLSISLAVFFNRRPDHTAGVHAAAPETASASQTPEATMQIEPTPSATIIVTPPQTTLPAKTEFIPPDPTPSVVSETVSPAPSVTAPKTAAATPTPAATAEPVTASPTPRPTPFTGYHYPNQVAESAPVGWEYFEDAVFIGDSRMEDFALFTGMAKYARFYTHVGVSVNQILANDPERRTRFLVEGEKLTLEEALTKYDDFSKVYIMLGYNEVGWPYPSEFVKYYTAVLDLIRSIQPDVQIYVECVIPVARKISGSGVDPAYENNENIAIFNRYIYEMCEQENVCFLNVQEALADDEGYLPGGAASDGIHMGKEYCMKWLEYIKCHTVQN